MASIADISARHDRQIEMAAFLRQIGGREIDGDVLVGKAEADRVQCVANPLAALGDRLVGQPDDGEGRAAGGDADLHLDSASLDANETQASIWPVHDALSAGHSVARSSRSDSFSPSS